MANHFWVLTHLQLRVYFYYFQFSEALGLYRPTSLNLNDFSSLCSLHEYIKYRVEHITIIITVSLISSHFTSLSLSLYHSYHFLSSAIATAYNYLRISLDHRVFTLARLAFTGTLCLIRPKYPHSSSLLLLSSHLISSYVNILCHSHFIL